VPIETPGRSLSLAASLPRGALNCAPLRRSSLEMVHWTISFAFGKTVLTHLLP